MALQMNDVTLIVNNVVIPYTADTLKSKDGFGEYSLRNAIVGGGQTESVFSKNLSDKNGEVSFSIPSTAENDGFKRDWKSADNNNVVELIGPIGSGFTKIFTLAAIMNDPEVDYSTDGDIEIEFKSQPAQ